MDATRFWRLEGGVDEWIDWAVPQTHAVSKLGAGWLPQHVSVPKRG